MGEGEMAEEEKKSIIQQAFEQIDEVRERRSLRPCLLRGGRKRLSAFASLRILCSPRLVIVHTLCLFFAYSSSHPCLETWMYRQ